MLLQSNWENIRHFLTLLVYPLPISSVGVGNVTMTWAHLSDIPPIQLLINLIRRQKTPHLDISFLLQRPQFIELMLHISKTFFIYLMSFTSFNSPSHGVYKLFYQILAVCWLLTVDCSITSTGRYRQYHKWLSWRDKTQ